MWNSQYQKKLWRMWQNVLFSLLWRKWHPRNIQVNIIKCYQTIYLKKLELVTEPGLDITWSDQIRSDHYFSIRLGFWNLESDQMWSKYVCEILYPIRSEQVFRSGMSSRDCRPLTCSREFSRVYFSLPVQVCYLAHSTQILILSQFLFIAVRYSVAATPQNKMIRTTCNWAQKGFKNW